MTSTNRREHRGSILPLLQVIVLACVQGLTEFLPVSSTAHLVILPHLMHWHDPGLGFDIALHLGTLLAVFIYFLPTWTSLLRSLWKSDSRNDDDHSPSGAIEGSGRRFAVLLIIATVPALIAGFLFHDAAERQLRNFLIIGTSMIVVGLYMWLCEVVGGEPSTAERLTVGSAIAIGLAQAIAIIPGVSRSGSTIATGLLCGLNREDATRFSFLLSTPVIAGATLFEGAHLMRDGLPADMRIPFLVGIAVSAIVGYATIWFLLRYLRTRTLLIFVVYRCVVGCVLLLFFWNSPL